MKLGKTYFSGSLTFDEGNNSLGPNTSTLTGSFTGSFDGIMDGTFTGTAAASISGSFIQDSSSLASRITDLENFELTLDATYATDYELGLVEGRLSNLETKNLLSSSAQIASDISGSFTELSSSVSSTYLLNTTDTLTGDLTVTGTITAQEFHTEFVSASIIFQSGSTQFGNSSDDTHVFTGTGFFDKVGIGTESPAESLDVSGSIKVGNLKLQDAAGGRIGFNRNTADGSIYNSNYAAFQINGPYSGADYLDFQNYNSSGTYLGSFVFKDGNVGIGHTNPTYRLFVRNDVAATSDLDPTSILLYNNSDGGAAIEFTNGVAGKSKLSFGVEGIGSSTDETYIGFSTGQNGGLVEQMRITSNGRVGIGTDAPDGNLQIYSSATEGSIRIGGGNGSGNSRIFIQSQGNSSYIDSYGDSQYKDLSIQAAKLLLNSNASTGNVGIGTTSPSAKLHVNAGAVSTPRGSGFTKFFFTGDHASTTYFEIQTPSTSAGDILFSDASGGDYGIVGYDHATDSMRFYTKSVINMFISGSGNVGIGTTNPFSQTHIYTVGTAGNNYYEGDLQVGGISSLLGAKLNYSSQNSGRVSLVNLNNGGGSASTIDLGFGAISTDGRPTNKAVTITQGGSVGIGTTSPSQILEVNGNVYASKYLLPDGGDVGWNGGYSSGNPVLAANGDEFRLYAAGNASTNILYLSDSRLAYGGNVGIGTTVTTYGKLSISSGDYNGIRIDTNAGYNAIGIGGTGIFSIDAPGVGAGRFIVNDSGNVGIGVAAPINILQVSGNLNADNSAVWLGGGYVNNSLYHYADAPVGISGRWGTAGDNGAGITFQSRNANNTNWYHGYMSLKRDGKFYIGVNGIGTTPGSDQITIDRAGNIGVGTTAPANPIHIYSANDLSLKLEGSNDWAGIVFADQNDFETIYFHGQHKTFSIGGQLAGGSNVADKKLHVDGGVTIGSSLDGTSVTANGLYVETSVRTRRVEYSWYQQPSPITSSTFTHFKTSLWMGGSPTGNTEYIMGGWVIKGYRYTSNGYGEGSVMFHNWVGTFYNPSVTNRGDWSNFVRSPYVSSDGYCVLVVENNDYSQPIFDFYQFYYYPWRTVTVTAYGGSNNLTGVY